MFNFKQIIEAWIIAGNPTPAQKELAEARGKICDECPSKKRMFKEKQWGEYCGECGCPIGKKILPSSIVLKSSGVLNPQLLNLYSIGLFL